LTVDELENYEGLKDFILSVSKLTPREYKARCDNATKRHDESFVYFAARLQNNFGYYLRSHEVNHDFNCLCDLLLADHLKTALPSAPLNYVLSLQGGDWFDPKRVAELVVHSPKFVHLTTVVDHSSQYTMCTVNGEIN